MVMPLIWLLSGSEAAPSAVDQESLKRASADLCSWIPDLFAVAARPKTYIEHIGFLMMAAGETPCSVLLIGGTDSIWPLQVPM